jgi:glycosyltransferase involved in cell wall biosynthesis
MRILFVTQIIPYPPHGGVLQRGFNLLKELGAEHDVHLLAFHHPDELATPEAVAASKAALEQFCKQVEYFDLWPKRSPLHKLVAFAAGALYPLPFSVLAQKNARLEARLRELCAQKAVDIVHLDTIGLAPLRKFCGSVPVVLAHHNIESQLMARRAQHEQSVFNRWYVATQAKRLTRYESQQATLFPLNITVSDADSRVLQEICPGAHAAAVPNGVDTEYFKPLQTQQGPELIYTGGMNMFANRDAVEWFLDNIWPKIRSAVPDARFHAVGTRPSQKVIDAAAANIGVDAPGFVDDVRPLVGRSAVYVVPLRVGGGTRLKMVDAMAQGKAIVATSLGAEGIEGENGHQFLLADEPQVFADVVIRLLGDPAVRSQLGAAARLRAEERYAWPILGKRLASLYRQVIEDAKR